MPARFSHFASEKQYKATRRVEKERMKMRTVAAFVALAVLVMFLVVVRPTLRSTALSSRVWQLQAGRPFLLAQEQGRSNAARATDAHDANASSLSRVTTVAAGGGGRSGDRLSIKEGDESLMLDSAGFRAAVAASASDASASDATPPPVVIALMNRFYFGDRYARVVPGCTWKKTGANLLCEFTADQERLNDSSALA